MSSLGLNTAIGRDQNASHQTERTVTLSDNIGLDISIIVLAGPNKATIALHGIGYHIIDQSVLVP
jgi:hypothetical protein